MVKKILYTVVSLAILAGGYIAAEKLGYWERSIRIFKFDSSQPFEGRMGRGDFERRGEFTGNRPQGQRPGPQELPDSARQRFASGQESGFRRPEAREIPDSLRRGIRESGGERRFEAGFRPGEGRGRGDFHGGRKVSLDNVWWFLLVFSAFTVLVIVLDNVYLRIRKRFISSNR